MSAKLLSDLANENPGSSRYKGCMSGVFRRHLIADRHLREEVQHARLLQANPGLESQAQVAKDKNLQRSSKENRRSSSELPRLSVSSYFCLSEDNEPTHRRQSSSHGRHKKKFTKNSERVVRSCTGSLDFREVEGSIHNDISGVSAKTTGKRDAKKVVIRQQDSPRPMALCLDLHGKFRESRPHLSKESARFSCDSIPKSTGKLKELPRLSLDSRKDVNRSLSSNCKCDSHLDDLERNRADNKLISGTLPVQQDYGCQKQSCSVIAKLMGLEEMPNSVCPSPIRYNLLRSSPCGNSPAIHKKKHKFSDSTEAAKQSRQGWISTPRSCNKDGETLNPQLRIEKAPWKEKGKVHHSKDILTPYKQNQSVYREYDKRQSGVIQSSGDLRALELILAAIGAQKSDDGQKSEGKKTPEYQCNAAYDTPRLANKAVSNSTESASITMKPAKSVKRCNTTPTPFIPLEGLDALSKVRVHDPANRKTAPMNNQTTKDRALQSSPQPAVDHVQASMQKKNYRGQHGKGRQRDRSARPQELCSPRLPSNEKVNTSHTLSPRTQTNTKQENRSHSPTLSSDSRRPQRQTQKASESFSPGAKSRMRPKQRQQNDENMKETTCLDVSPKSNTSIARSVDCCTKLSSNDSLIPSNQENSYNVGSKVRSKNLEVNISEDNSPTKLEQGSSEQASPITVLDTPFDKDVSQPLPAKKTKCLMEDREPKNLEGPCKDACVSAGLDSSSSRMDGDKRRNIEALVQKLSQLGHSDGREPMINHMAKLYNTNDQDQRYITEILVSSGLLFRDLSGPQKPSGISPDLFLVLEQRRTSTTKDNSICENSDLKHDTEKLHRKLLFDTVNEILVTKLSRQRLSPHLLVQDLCSDVKQLQADAFQGCNSNSIELDGLELLLRRDLMRKPETWIALEPEVDRLVLDIERSLFRDLITEFIHEEYHESEGRIVQTLTKHSV